MIIIIQFSSIFVKSIQRGSHNSASVIMTFLRGCVCVFFFILIYSKSRVFHRPQSEFTRDKNKLAASSEFQTTKINDSTLGLMDSRANDSVYIVCADARTSKRPFLSFSFLHLAIYLYSLIAC